MDIRYHQGTQHVLIVLCMPCRPVWEVVYVCMKTELLIYMSPMEALCRPSHLSLSVLHFRMTHVSAKMDI